MLVDALHGTWTRHAVNTLLGATDVALKMRDGGTTLHDRKSSSNWQSSPAGRQQLS